MCPLEQGKAAPKLTAYPQGKGRGGEDGNQEDEEGPATHR